MNKDYYKLDEVAKLFPKIESNDEYLFIYNRMYVSTKNLNDNDKSYILKAEINKYQRQYNIIGMLACYRLLIKVDKNEDKLYPHKHVV